MARLMISAGGTGGHVYPALATAEALRRLNPDSDEIVFVGTRGSGGLEKRLVDESGIDFAAYAAVFAGPLNGVSPLRALSSLVKIGLGWLQALWLIGRYRPQAMLLTGGWPNVPLGVAAWMLRVPMLVYLPDIEPARTIQLLSKLRPVVATTTPDSAQYFRAGQTITTGYPLREAITSGTLDAAMAHFSLMPERKTILVTGGSRGARSINKAMGDIAADLIEMGAQIIHITGHHDWERANEQTQHLSDNAHYCSRPYLDSSEMGLAFAAADIVVGRAGASALGEFTHHGAAAILIPYPYAWRYQKVNADYLVKHGAAQRIDDEDMATALLPALQDWLEDPSELERMQQNAAALNNGNGADHLALQLRALAGENDD